MAVGGCVGRDLRCCGLPEVKRRTARAAGPTAWWRLGRLGGGWWRLGRRAAAAVGVMAIAVGAIPASCDRLPLSLTLY